MFEQLDASQDQPRLYYAENWSALATQGHTRDAFSAKWAQYDYQDESYLKSLARQKQWYLDLYGFESEQALAQHLASCDWVLDAGAGTCGKAAWFAQLCPGCRVIAADISESLEAAARHFADLENLYFVRCDIGSLDWLSDSVIDYVSCDQVIHHTTDPAATFRELVRVLASGRDFSCYVYRKKALPRELLDDHFRTYSQQLSHDELMELSRQLTELGRLLTDEREFDFPKIPALGIEGGRMTIQRFVYWNFLKCYWNEQQGEHISTMANFDWYAPSQAARYTEAEFRHWVDGANLEAIHFHEEPACYSGRFRKSSSATVDAK